MEWWIVKLCCPTGSTSHHTNNATPVLDGEAVLFPTALYYNNTTLGR